MPREYSSSRATVYPCCLLCPHWCPGLAVVSEQQRWDLAGMMPAQMRPLSLFRAVPSTPGSRLTIQGRFFEPGIQKTLGSLESRKRGHSTEQLVESFVGEFLQFFSCTCNVAGTAARTFASTVAAGNDTSLKGM